MNVADQRSEDEPRGGAALEQFNDIYLDDYAPFLAGVESQLSTVTTRPGSTLGDSCSLTLEAGGKRMRPLLVMLSMKRGERADDRVVSAAVSVELVHMATLVHDDVLDGAELRRGEPTVVARFGPGVSVSSGDYMFSAAFEILARSGSVEAVSLLAGTSLDLSRGELLQMSGSGDLSLSVETYEKRCRLKTASLFSTSCQLGALLSGCGEKATKALGEYGICIGLAFQISDDILDFSTDSDRIGKTFAADLRDGTVTLPLIYAMEADQDLAGSITGELSEERLLEICGRIERTGALDRAREKAYGFVDAAIRALGRAGDEVDTEPLKLIAEATVDRKR